MPKHYIYPAPNTDGSTSDRRVELNWQRDGGVQIATTVWPGAPGTDPDTTVDWDGQFVELSRTHVNHLIKQLRIARDQAFGRDE